MFLRSLSTGVSQRLNRSKVNFELSSVTTRYTTNLQTIFADAKKANKNVIITATPGPFKPTDALPDRWMDKDIPFTKGCTPQLNAFQEHFNELNAVIININTQASDYQYGPDGLIAAKKLSDLLMISYKDTALTEELSLKTSPLNGQSYLERFSFVKRPDGVSQTFSLASPVNPDLASAHIAAIKAFVKPELVAEEEAKSEFAVSKM